MLAVSIVRQIGPNTAGSAERLWGFDGLKLDRHTHKHKKKVFDFCFVTGGLPGASAMAQGMLNLC
jgi:hypothetical protein